MAVQDPCWDYGEVKFINSSGVTNDPDVSWDYGELKIFHEYKLGIPVQQECLQEYMQTFLNH